MLEVGGDDMVAWPNEPLDRDVERVGAIEREDPALGGIAAKKLVEDMAAMVERSLGGDGHAMTPPARIGQAVAGEIVECPIDRLGLGKAGGGVVEVDHSTAQISSVESSRLGDVVGSAQDGAAIREDGE